MPYRDAVLPFGKRLTWPSPSYLIKFSTKLLNRFQSWDHILTAEKGGSLQFSHPVNRVCFAVRYILHSFNVSILDNCMWTNHHRLPASPVKISQQFWNTVPLAYIRWLWAESYPRNACFSHWWKGSLGWILEKEKNSYVIDISSQSDESCAGRLTRHRADRQDLSQMYWIFFTLIHWEIVLLSTQHKVNEYSTAALQEWTPK